MKQTTINITVAHRSENGPDTMTRRQWTGYAFTHLGVELVVHLNFKFDEDSHELCAIPRNWTVSDPATGRRFVSNYNQLPNGRIIVGTLREPMTRAEAVAAGRALVESIGPEKIKAAIAKAESARYRGAI